MMPIEPRDRWALSVFVMVRDARRRVLMLRRSPSAKNFPGTWELPGGKPAPGESVDRTACLEVAEETGLCIKLSGVVGAAESALPGLRLVMLIFDAPAPSTEITLSAEHDRYAWLPLSRAASLHLRPGFDAFIAKCLPGHRRKPAARRPRRKA